MILSRERPAGAWTTHEAAIEILSVIGTRPEAIKMALLLLLEREPSIVSRLCATGQHREMLAQVLKLFGLTADDGLEVMRAGQDLTQVTCRVLEGIRGIVAERRPDLVLVHGDTSTTLSAALAAFYARLPVRHVETGLRTGNLASPWPEEANRRLVSVLAERHYAPTDSAGPTGWPRASTSPRSS